MRPRLLVLGMLLTGGGACAPEPTTPPTACGEPLAPDFATDRPWPEAVEAWALARPADTLVHPALLYRSAITAQDSALVLASGGVILRAFAGQPTLPTEFRAAALAAFASGDQAALEARIRHVEFGLSLCLP